MNKSIAGYDPLERVLFSREAIALRVAAMARAIQADAEAAGAGEITVIAVADGGLMFASDLIRELRMSVRFVSVKVSAYGDGMTPRDEAVVTGAPECIRDEYTLVVEDILDSGVTLDSLCRVLRAGAPSALRTAVLLDKPTGRRREFVADYTGFVCPDAFVVGYGLDLAGRYRNLPDIGVLRRALQPS